MLHDIGRWIFLEQPARKGPAPLFGIVGAGRTFKNGDPHKRPLIRVGFPRRGSFTRANKQRDFAKADRFAGLQFKITGLAIAFVKQADDGDAFRHWRAFLAVNRCACCAGCGLGLGNFRRRRRCLIIAGRQGKRTAAQQDQAQCPHAASGLHG
jgi:hypothetical protein